LTLGNVEEDNSRPEENIMKTAILVLALTAAVITGAQAQTDKQSHATSAGSKALIDLENKWVDALVKNDAATLDAIFADTYVDTDEQGHRGTKQDVMAVMKSGDLKIESIKLADMKVNVYGDAAVVTGSATQAGNYKDQALTAKIIFTDTFVRKNGKWVAVASHRSAA
jgi:hypothetical protein